MRGIALRWPLSLLSGDKPIDFINQDLKVALLKANYAVVSMDVRGTGAAIHSCIVSTPARMPSLQVVPIPR